MFASDAACSICVFNAVAFGLTALYFALLRFRRGESIGICNTIVAVMAFHQCVVFTTVDLYVLYGERVPKDEPALPSDLFAKFKFAVASGFRWYGKEMDERVFLAEYQPLMKSIFGVGFGVVGSLLGLMTWVGHLQGCSCIYVTQTVSAVWSIAVMFCWVAPEFLEGGKHLHNPLYFLFTTTLPILVYSIFAIGSAYCHTSGTCATGQAVCSLKEKPKKN